MQGPHSKIKIVVCCLQGSQYGAMLFEWLSEMEEMVPGYECFSLSCGSGIRCSIPTVDHGNKESSRVVRNSLYSIDWAHKIDGLDVPSVHPMISAVKESSSRLYGRPVVKKEVITSEMLSMLAHKYFDYHPSLYQARTVALCLTAFAGFLRYDELSNLLCLDVKFYPDYFLLFIESSKSDQYRDGAWVPISFSNLITCPLRALKRYSDLGEIVFDSHLPLFRGINGPNAKAKLRRSKLSYSRVRELVKEAFKDCIDSTLIGVHSLRAGGASAAANN